MVLVGLQISCQFENIESLKTCHPSYSFFVKVKCSNCGEEDGNWHDITEDSFDGEDSRNPKGFNFFMKCKLCNRTNSIDVVQGSNVTYEEIDAGKFKTIVSFDCRGMEPVEFSPRTGWIARAIDGGSVFNDIDLSDDDWADYDEKKDLSVGISEFKSQFITIKKR